ncbi:MAG: hypothetical protein U0807_09295 [Candidatus Binatia bacterium]
MERMVVEEAITAVRALIRPPVLVVDSLAEHAHQVADLVAQLIGSHTILQYESPAERFQRLRHIENAFGVLPWEQQELKGLTEAESLTLCPWKLRAAGFLGGRSLSGR